MMQAGRDFWSSLVQPTSQSIVDTFILDTIYLVLDFLPSLIIFQKEIFVKVKTGHLCCMSVDRHMGQHQLPFSSYFHCVS